MRRGLVWPSATRLATITLTAAMTAMLARQSITADDASAAPTRMSAPSPAIRTTTATYASDVPVSTGAWDRGDTTPAIITSPASRSARPADPRGVATTSSADSDDEPVASARSMAPTTTRPAAPSVMRRPRDSRSARGSTMIATPSARTPRSPLATMTMAPEREAHEEKRQDDRDLAPPQVARVRERRTVERSAQRSRGPDRRCDDHDRHDGGRGRETLVRAGEDEVVRCERAAAWYADEREHGDRGERREAGTRRRKTAGASERRRAPPSSDTRDRDDQRGEQDLARDRGEGRAAQADLCARKSAHGREVDGRERDERRQPAQIVLP